MALQREVAEHLFISDRQVRNLQQSGILPTSKGKGGLDLEACRRQYIEYLRGQKTGQVDGANEAELEAEPGDIIGGINVPLQEARKKQYDADTKEHRLFVLRKEYAPVELITDAVSQVATMLVSNLNSLPMKMKVADPSLSGRSVDAVKKVIAGLCNELADFEIDLSDYTPVDPEGGSAGATGTTNTETAHSG